MKIKAIIVDDEPYAREIIATYIQSLNIEIDICGSYSNVSDAKKYIDQFKPNIVFLDIQMNDETGFDLLEQFQIPYPFKVIFTTAFDQYAIRAIKAKAYDYLLKPIDRSEFSELVEELVRNLVIESRMNVNPSYFSRTIELNSNTGREFISFSQVLYCKGESNYTSIYTEKKTYLISKTMKYVSENILPFEHLVRCHKSYAFNSIHFSKMSASKVVLINGQEVPISRTYKEKLGQLFIK